MSNLPVDRCVCADVTFSQMKAHVDRDGGDVSSLHQLFGCGGGCSLCVPYIRAMLTTGRTKFAVDDEALRIADAPDAPGNPRPL